MNLIIILLIWPALLAGITSGCKKLAQTFGVREHPAFVRALPVLPFAFGGVTGLYVLPAVAALADLQPIVELPMIVHAVFGFGAGAVAGQAFKVLQQTIKGADLRITGGKQ